MGQTYTEASIARILDRRSSGTSSGCSVGARVGPQTVPSGDFSLTRFRFSLCSSLPAAFASLDFECSNFAFLGLVLSGLKLALLLRFRRSLLGLLETSREGDRETVRPFLWPERDLPFCRASRSEERRLYRSGDPEEDRSLRRDRMGSFWWVVRTWRGLDPRRLLVSLSPLSFFRLLCLAFSAAPCEPALLSELRPLNST